ncbi:unnamed protein product [Blepharisma stoltei]|uniref:Uncharacterized protein n=1 Tax=Blepharisma stoltei TaxID=1481888 RepID=A0AAU9IRW0_9CILI|nr:unnamed protein product [Blepharisma stoltei]
MSSNQSSNPPADHLQANGFLQASNVSQLPNASMDISQGHQQCDIDQINNSGPFENFPQPKPKSQSLNQPYDYENFQFPSFSQNQPKPNPYEAYGLQINYLPSPAPVINDEEKIQLKKILDDAKSRGSNSSAN